MEATVEEVRLVNLVVNSGDKEVAPFAKRLVDIVRNKYHVLRPRGVQKQFF